MKEISNKSYVRKIPGLNKEAGFAPLATAIENYLISQEIMNGYIPKVPGSGDGEGG
jgi:hypothetical protein